MLRASKLRQIALTIAVGDAPPSEFRIFKAGENSTSKGSFIFDEEAAKLVMAAYQEHGADIMIDLEHLSVEDPEKSVNFDPDARGWCKLELRNGELWAVSVTWTSDGIARLTDKRQRYISPVFAFDPETGRVAELFNIAITAMPATDDLVPLVAASRRARDLRTKKLTTGFSFGDVARALQEALNERFPYSWICDIYDASIVYEVEGKLFELSYTFNGSVATLAMSPVEVKRTYAPVAATPAPAPTPAPAAAAARRQKLTATEGDTTMTPEQLAQLADILGLGADANVEDVLATVAAMVKKVQDAANGTAPANDTAADAPPAAAKDAAPMVAAARMVVASRVLVRLSGKKEIGEVLREVEAWHTSHVELGKQTAALAAERATLESSERRRLVAELVKLGAEIPATAWSDEKGTEPAEPWASMPIEQLRSRVEKLTVAKGGTVVRSSAGTQQRTLRPVPPPNEKGGQVFEIDGESVEVSAREIEFCKQANAKPEDYARNKLIQLKAQRGRRPA